MIMAPMHALGLIPEEAAISDYDLEVPTDKDGMLTFTYETEDDEPNETNLQKWDDDDLLNDVVH